MPLLNSDKISLISQFFHLLSSFEDRSVSLDRESEREREKNREGTKKGEKEKDREKRAEI